MKVIFVRFGKIENPKFTKVYEGIVKGNEVQVLMPKASHSGARDILENLGFGDVEIFMVTGKENLNNERDGIYLENAKVVQKLEYDSNQEKIIFPEKPETPMAQFAKKHPKDEIRKMKNHYEAGLDAAYHKIGGWQLFLNLFFAGWPTFLTPKSVR